MTKEEFRQNIMEALGDPWSLVDSSDIDFLTELLYNPKKTWTYNDFRCLAEAINKEDGDVVYAVGEYDICPNITDPDNQNLMVEWFGDHRQAYKDVLLYISKHKSRR